MKLQCYWITPKEFEDIYKIKMSTQAKWRMKNIIPYSKFGKFIRYNKLLIDELFENHNINNN